MTRHPVKLVKRALSEVDNNAVDVVEPDSRANPFFSFHYSYTEMCVRSGRTHVVSKRARFEDGKLSSEAFEGELHRNVYDRSVSDAQRYLAGQTALFLQSLSLFLPFSGKHRRDRD